MYLRRISAVSPLHLGHLIEDDKGEVSVELGRGVDAGLVKQVHDHLTHIAEIFYEIRDHEVRRELGEAISALHLGAYLGHISA